MDTDNLNHNPCESVFIRGQKKHSRPFALFATLRLKKSEKARHLLTGEWGERVAEKYLRKNKYKTIGRRVRVGRRDELDLIMRSPNGVLVFVEVKTRGSEDFGRPFSSVNKRKRENLSRAALGYLKKLREKPDHFRFDVVEVIGSEGHKDRDVRHIENAFALSGGRRINW